MHVTLVRVVITRLDAGFHRAVLLLHDLKLRNRWRNEYENVLQ